MKNMVKNIRKKAIADIQRIYLRAALEKAELTPYHLAQELDMSPPYTYIYDFLKGRKQSMKPKIWDDIEKILKDPVRAKAEAHSPDDGETEQEPPNYIHFSGMPVIGYVEAGSFRESNQITDKFIPAMFNPVFPNATQYSLQIRGDSIDKYAREGDYACCVKWEDTGWGLERAIGKFVVVAVTNDEGFTNEYTIKRLNHNGETFVLTPESNNPDYSSMTVNGEIGQKITITALVSHFHIDAL